MALLSRVLLLHSDKSDKNAERFTGSLKLVSPISSNTSSGASTPSQQGKASNSGKRSPKISNPIVLNIKLESPPVVLYGHPHESTGSIISGILKLEIFGATTDLENVTLSLVQTMKYSRTFCISSTSVTSCKDCKYKKTTLARWDVLTTKASFDVGTHGYPFSHLIPGSLPPTSDLGSSHSTAYIEYELIAVALTPNNLEEITVRVPVHISRSILRGPDRNSLRVFPPTEVTATAVLPNVIYPKSTFPIELKLDNIVSNKKRWRMRKLVWRVEESTSIRAHTCEKHEQKLVQAFESNRKSPRVTGGGGSNVHHSTIRTGVAVLSNASEHYHGARNSQQQGLHPSHSRNSERALDEPESDLVNEQTPAPARAQESFNEDFPIEVTASVGGNALTPARSQATIAGSETPTTAPTVADEPALYLEEIRTISHGEYRSGWKSDFSNQGHIELVAEISAKGLSTSHAQQVTQRSSDEGKAPELSHDSSASCDIDDPTLGVFVSHTLIVEIVVAEEVTHATGSGASVRSGGGITPTRSNGGSTGGATGPNTGNGSNSGKSSPALTGSPTGSARVLRMQFKLFLTERSGLGIAWDDEIPPTYQDVHSFSPPIYSEASGTATPLLSPLPSARLADSANATPRILHGIGNTPGLHPSISIGQALEGMQEFTL